MRVRASLEAELRKSTERFEASRVGLDDLKAELSALAAEFDGVEAQSALEKGALEEKNTNLESEIQRAYSMQRYLESQLKDRLAKFGLRMYSASSYCHFFFFSVYCYQDRTRTSEGKVCACRTGWQSGRDATHFPVGTT
jgi:hypothetical protein